MATNLYIESSKLIAFATSLDPLEVYNVSSNPLPAVMPSVVRETVYKKAEESSLNLITDDEDVAVILQYGIRDVQAVLKEYLIKQPSIERALDFIDHERTITSLAKIAFQDENSSEDIIKDFKRNKFFIPSAAPCLILPKEVAQRENIVNPLSGCPAAEHSDAQPIKPLFKKFVRWSGRLALQTLAHHDLIPALKQKETK